MPSLKDLTGQRFGRLLVIEREASVKGRTRWRCKCDCGNETIAQSALLTKGKKRSCGCYAKDYPGHKTHGKKRTKLYGVWCTMKSRCNNDNSERYKDYGGRGIKVCEEWLRDFQAFYEWAYANGYENGLTIDRIDVNGDYAPSNCRWATMKAQSNNRRNNTLYTFDGKTQTLHQWADEYGVKYSKLWARLNELHWDFEKAISTR